MNSQTLPIPAHFKPGRVGKVWKVDYQKLTGNASQWRKEFNISPAAQDTFRIALLLVDVQNTFCLPNFELYVGGRSGTGAVDDNRRLSEFIYRNLHRITQIIPTMDTHQAMQIFHSIFFVNDAGEHPAPYTMISPEDIEQGRWRFNEALAPNLGMSAEYVNRHLKHYTESLHEGGKYQLTIWPYHAMLGGIGHALVPAIEEAIFFHSMVRETQPDFQIKGNHPLTEHYSVLGAEVNTDPEGKILVEKNQRLFQHLIAYDAIIIAGQAKSHCVAWTVTDLLESMKEKDPRLAEKVYLLEDCTSPVVVPGVIDYTEDADAAYQRFQEAGMHLVKSTEPISSWEGVIQEIIS